MLTPTVNGAGGDAVTITSELWTANETRVVLSSGATSAAVLPPGFVVAGDDASIGASTQTADGYRLVQRALATQPELEMPVAIGASVDQAAARWDGEWELVHLFLGPAVPGARFWRVAYVASRAWVAANGDQTLSLVDVRKLPGWTDAIPVAEPGESARWKLSGSTGDIVADYETSGADGAITF
jgi:hypothetical protein